MKESSATTHDGKVVSVIGDKLTTTCGEGKQHCHTMAKDAKVTCDGKAAKAADLEYRGVADHRMIESIYLRDPDGYVIELYE